MFYCWDSQLSDYRYACWHLQQSQNQFYRAPQACTRGCSLPLVRIVSALYSSQTFFLKSGKMLTGNINISIVSWGTKGTAQALWNKYRHNRHRGSVPTTYSTSLHRKTAWGRKPDIPFYKECTALLSYFPPVAQHGMERKRWTRCPSIWLPIPAVSCPLDQGHRNFQLFHQYYHA